MDLRERHCTPCARGGIPLPREQAEALAKELPGWSIRPDGAWLVKRFPFKNFVDALAFVNRVGAVAEAEGHHPDMKLGWGYAAVELQTHTVGGLQENDFILAAQIEALLR